MEMNWDRVNRSKYIRLLLVVVTVIILTLRFQPITSAPNRGEGLPVQPAEAAPVVDLEQLSLLIEWFEQLDTDNDERWENKAKINRGELAAMISGAASEDTTLDRHEVDDLIDRLLLMSSSLKSHDPSSEISKDTLHNPQLTEELRGREGEVQPFDHHYTYDPSRILIVQFADEMSSERYKHQMASVKCWATRMGYQYETGHPKRYSMCQRINRDFWHAQICGLHELLHENIGKIDYVVKLDGDVVGGTADFGLEHWLDGADFIVQERLFTAEINAGFYMIRNTPAGRDMMQDWSQWAYRWRSGPGGGYNGMDNGSIHQVIIDALELEGRNECYWQFMNLGNGTNFSQYFEFVACARRLIGPPRRHRNPINGVGVTIWPAAFGPMNDLHMLLAYQYIGPQLRNFYVLHHGIKQSQDEVVIGYYGEPETWGDISVWPNCVKWDLSPEQDALGQKKINEMALGYVRPIVPGGPRINTGYNDVMGNQCFDSFSAFTGDGHGPWHYRVPRWNLFDDNLKTCFESYLNCRPLDPEEEVQTPGYRCREPLSYGDENLGAEEYASVEVIDIGMWHGAYDGGVTIGPPSRNEDASTQEPSTELQVAEGPSHDSPIIMDGISISETPHIDDTNSRNDGR